MFADLVAKITSPKRILATKMFIKKREDYEEEETVLRYGILRETEGKSRDTLIWRRKPAAFSRVGR